MTREILPVIRKWVKLCVLYYLRVGVVIYVLTVQFDGTVGLAVKFEWFLGMIALGFCG